MYNQQERSGSFKTVGFLGFVGFQISLFFVTAVVLFSVGTVLSLLVASGFVEGVVLGNDWVISCMTVFANCFALLGSLSATYRSKISSSVSRFSSRIVSRLVVGVVVVLFVIRIIG
jgi:hypothetical protein